MSRLNPHQRMIIYIYGIAILILCASLYVGKKLYEAGYQNGIEDCRKPSNYTNQDRLTLG